MSRPLLLCAALSAGLLSASAAWPQAVLPQAAGAPAAGPLAVGPAVTPAPAPIANAAVPANYLIGRDDSLEVVVFQVPELSRVVKVDADGMFNLPFVGNVKAAGHTADEIATTLRERLNGRYLHDPQVTVMVTQAVSQRVTIDGAVMRPGVYALSGRTTLVQAIALANGPDPRFTNARRVALSRNVSGTRKTQVYDLSRIRDGKAPDPEVQPDDVIVVDSSSARSFFSVFGQSLGIVSAFVTHY